MEIYKMKKVLMLAFALLISTSIMFAQAPVAKKIKAGETKTEVKTEAKNTPAPVAKKTVADKPAKGQKAITGDIVNLLSAITNAKAPALTKEEATGMAARGELLGLRAGTKLYLVVMADGINASKKLAEKAGAKVSLTGKVKAKGGINVLILD
jgi:hypothetical protein